MPRAVQGVLGRLQRFWNEFSVAQRTLALIATAALILGAVALGSWLTRPTMSPVFTDLSATDASAIVDQLSSQGVPYTLAAGGTTVMVPADQVYSLRVKLAASGLPTQSDGYSLLDQMGVGASDFQQQVTYRRALEGELARTVGAIEGVETASVHLAIPEDSVFTDQAQVPTAAVFLRLHTGKVLDQGSVQAIQNLVAASVPGMQATKVSIVDAAGRDLTQFAAAGGDSSERDQKIAVQVQGVLDRVLGTGSAVVSVTSDISADSTLRTTESFTYTDGVPPLSEKSTSEQYTGTGQAVGGVLGPDNIAVPNGTEGGNGSYESQENTTNNAVNKVTEQTTVQPGAVRRQSVSVVVDAAKSAGLGQRDLEAMVSAAAGIDTARGDQLSVTRAAFSTEQADQAQEALNAADQILAQQDKERRDMQTMAMIAGAILLVVLAILFLLRGRRRKSGRREAAEAHLAMEEEVARRLDVLDAGDMHEALELADEAPALPPVLKKPDADSQMKNEVSALADDDPEAVAERLREWLAVRH